MGFLVGASWWPLRRSSNCNITAPTGLVPQIDCQDVASAMQSLTQPVGDYLILGVSIEMAQEPSILAHQIDDRAVVHEVIFTTAGFPRIDMVAPLDRRNLLGRAGKADQGRRERRNILIHLGNSIPL